MGKPVLRGGNLVKKMGDLVVGNTVRSTRKGGWKAGKL